MARSRSRSRRVCRLGAKAMRETHRQIARAMALGKGHAYLVEARENGHKPAPRKSEGAGQWATVVYFCDRCNLRLCALGDFLKTAEEAAGNRCKGGR